MALRAPAVFVDRDGTLIREVGYLSRSDQIEVLPRVPEAIQELHAQGLKVVVVTNQSAVARKIISEKQLHQIHRHLESVLKEAGAFLDGIYYCPHHPTEGAYPYRVSCVCRKPKPGLVERASIEMALDPTASYVIGDQISDMELAFRAGARGLLIQPESQSDGQAEVRVRQPTHVPVTDFWTATQRILRHLKGEGSLEE
ncbi:MAG: HAD-IIIA family hydrolase [Deltaproteobacteria bacterium]|nr:HAD-IIIA family hydrolase [Deltaproteobacteria bacterium]